MALHDRPPHKVDLYSVASGEDSGGGSSLAYASAQADVPASINTAGASTQARYAQQQIVVTHTIGILSAKLSVTVARGWKAVADDTGDTYHVHGIRKGRAYGGVPAFHYLDVEQLL